MVVRIQMNAHGEPFALDVDAQRVDDVANDGMNVDGLPFDYQLAAQIRVTSRRSSMSRASATFRLTISQVGRSHWGKYPRARAAP